MPPKARPSVPEKSNRRLEAALALLEMHDGKQGNNSRPETELVLKELGQVSERILKVVSSNKKNLENMIKQIKQRLHDDLKLEEARTRLFVLDFQARMALEESGVCTEEEAWEDWFEDMLAD